MSYTYLHYAAALLHAYGVKHVVASPGTQNAFFNLILDSDPRFTVISAVDERSAAYIAKGLSAATGELVALTCTEATASRNYLSALTECYYSHLPVVALTFYNAAGSASSLAPQFCDRSQPPRDTQIFSAQLRAPASQFELMLGLELMHQALFTAQTQHGPVHLNIPSICNWSAAADLSLPQVAPCRTITRDELSKIDWSSLQHRRTAIFIGAHARFEERVQDLIGKCAERYGLPVFCELSSGYFGANRISTALASAQLSLPDDVMPQFIIDMGGICADYFAARLFAHAQVLRLSPDGKFTCRFHRIPQFIFTLNEKDFFADLLQLEHFGSDNSYAGYVLKMAAHYRYPPLPLSTALVQSLLSVRLRGRCSLHLSILNAYRMANCFNFAPEVEVSCNTGGFGIDGAVSTLVGTALAERSNLCVGVVGDLAFFYDMNVLGLRDIPPNLRLIVINNSGGEEFRLNRGLNFYVKDKIEPTVAAAGHYRQGVKAWAQSCGFHYQQVTSSEELPQQLDALCCKDAKRPMLLEVFTQDKNEQIAFRQLFGN